MKKPASASRHTPKDHEAPFPPLDRPPHFYKYTSIDEKHEEFSSCIFTDNQLYFRPANEFNDPFDCKFQVQSTRSKKDAFGYSQYLAQEYSRGSNRRERRATASEDSKAFRDPDVLHRVRKGMMQTRETSGICCLSAVRDDILMWSHYAKAHQGFCLEFSSDLHVIDLPRTKRRVLPLPIMYSPTYPVVILGQRDNRDDLHKMVRQIFLTKAEQWNYEDEWRMIILHKTKEGLYKFPPQCLTGVIFGCLMLDEHKDKIPLWCKDREPVIKYYQAQEREDSYSLDRVEVL